MMGKDVNCVPLPLNCLLVALITVLIDAEIKLLPRARKGSEPECGMADKRLSWRTYGDGTALKVCSICLPTPHGLVSGVPIAQPGERFRQNDTK